MVFKLDAVTTQLDDSQLSIISETDLGQLRKTTPKNVKFFLPIRKNNRVLDLAYPVTKKEFQQRVELEAEHLHVVGISRGDIVAIPSFSILHVLQMVEALHRLGASFIPLQSSGKVLFEELQAAHVTVLISLPTVLKSLLEYSETTDAQLDVKRVICVGDTPGEIHTQLKKRFNCSVVNTVGTTAIGPYAVEKKPGLYTVLSNSLTFAVRTDERWKNSSVTGEILVQPNWMKHKKNWIATGDIFTVKKRSRDKNTQFELVGSLMRKDEFFKHNGCSVNGAQLRADLSDQLSLPHDSIQCLAGTVKNSDTIALYIHSLYKHPASFFKRRAIKSLAETYFGEVPVVVFGMKPLEGGAPVIHLRNNPDTSSATMRSLLRKLQWDV